MRIIFMGTPTFAVPVLEALIDAGHEIAAVYTQPPRPAGRRGRMLVESAVQNFADVKRIKVRSPASLRNAEQQQAFDALKADVAVVAAYGLILPQPILDAPRLGCLNVHASLLPRWRGAAPIQRAILSGDSETGVCIMQMEAGLDTGPVRLCKSTWIGIDDAEKITDRLSTIGAELMCTVLARLDAYPPLAQDENYATYAPKIEKAEARLNFQESAVSLARKVQAFTRKPGAFFEIDGERIKVFRARALNRWPNDVRLPGEIVDLIDAGTNWGKPSKRDSAFAIACGDGYLLPELLQRAGKAFMPPNDFLQGFRSVLGKVAE
ncbi:methionyl-tRNA formyltransferase [Sphingomonas sp. SUN019]|uniref:methionyl-tRNA formyltransferase n=1 Tax=Sphingomonas sp. SUN019 TaxID=2937788 RepID=UPI0021647B1B|nr:methionyl-tRNA formyltransferase [Sphingomonas sp. SUN019]UVO49182.1 methionyl-tRNA formyltransferase [Sphingomonas sp. SUN019]